MRKVIVFILATFVLAGIALAKDTPQARRLSDQEIAGFQPGGRQDCVIGNLNAPAWAIGGWFTGAEHYKLLVNPFEQCACPMGFRIEWVHMALQFPDDGTVVYPLTFTIIVDLEDAWWNPDPGCWWPGVEDCVSEAFDVTIDGPGLWDVGAPIVCDCAWLVDPTGMPYWYLISVYFVDMFAADIVTDDFPSACTSFNDWGSGWVDLDTYGFPGNLIMWADAMCCEDPVAQEHRTWGDVKRLFR